MTRSKFFLKDGLLQGFTLDGHSGAGEAGTDIICAAVSSAAYLIANTLTEVMGCQASAADADGHMACLLYTSANRSQGYSPQKQQYSTPPCSRLQRATAQG